MKIMYVICFDRQDYNIILRFDVNKKGQTNLVQVLNLFVFPVILTIELVLFVRPSFLSL